MSNRRFQREMLPESVRRFTVGRWPGVWLGVACLLVFWVFAAPRFAEARTLREEIALKRGLIERQALLVSQESREQARAAELARWWREGAEQRVRAQTLELAQAELQRRVTEVFGAAGVGVTQMQRTRADTLSDAPAAQLVVLSVRLQANTMGAIAEALRVAETETSPWLRIGNASIVANPYRTLPGVQVDATIYACIESTSTR